MRGKREESIEQQLGRIIGFTASISCPYVLRPSRNREFTLPLRCPIPVLALVEVCLHHTSMDESGLDSGVIRAVVPLPSGLSRWELGGHAPQVLCSCFLQLLLTWYHLRFLLSRFSSSGHTLIKFLPKMWCPDLNIMLQIHSTHRGTEGGRCFLCSESCVSVSAAEVCRGVWQPGVPVHSCSC